MYSEYIDGKYYVDDFVFENFLEAKHHIDNSHVAGRWGNSP